MDFALNEEQQAMRRMALEFAMREAPPELITQYDREERYPIEIVRKMGPLGMLGGVVPEQYGGAAMSYITVTVLIEALSYVWDQLAVAASATSTSRGQGLLRFGTEEQQQRYLRPLCQGEHIATAAMTEPGSGNDVAGMVTSARRHADDYIINGVKTWIAHLDHFSWCITFAQMDPSKGRRGISAFIVERNRPGVEISLFSNRVGFRSYGTGTLTLNNVRVPKECRLGEEGAGLRVAMAGAEVGRLTGAARALGGIARCLDESIKYAQTRIVFGQPIGRYQLVQNKITDMALGLESARWLVYHYAWLKDQGVQQARKEASMAKMYATDLLMQAAIDACQIHGAYSCSEEYVVGRLFRDAKWGQIVEGTNEIHRVLIAEYALGYRAS